MTGRIGRILACSFLAFFGFVVRPSCGQPLPCTAPPQVICPGNITRFTDQGGGVIVNYTASASDACGLKSFACAPPSGFLFPAGTTIVTCTALNLGDFSASCAFRVTIEPNPVIPALDRRGLLALALLLTVFGALLARRM
jgi:hypothetical protein